MLRVLILSTLFPDASRPNFGVFVERQTLGLAAREDVALQVVAPLGIPPWPLGSFGHYRSLSALPAQEQWKGLTVHRPRFANFPGTGGRHHAAMLVRALVPLLTAIRRDFPFDVINAEYFFPDGVAAVELGRRFGVPVAIKARGSDIDHWARSPVTGPQVVAAANRADGLLSVSQALRDDMAALGMPRERIECIYTGVDLTRFAPADRAAAKAALGIDGPLIASVGALIPRKGHAIVIDAVAALPGVHLHIAGEGPERPRLEAQIARLGVGDRVRLLGPVAHDALPPLLAAADVMALASRFEGLANAWLEALASGTPVVITDVGGARQVVRGPAAGRIVDPEPKAFAEAIRALIAAPPEAGMVRAAAEPFTWSANSVALHGFLRELVDRRAAAGDRTAA
ncbi:MAG: glycosyltransferase [Sphingomonas sp.]|uniref:glycosyltransferase n=1 Tax=Sphingomonas sp. TaxID=28214 RepID=UPI001B14ABE9|nr:glycosyltransferase [Sphingomonas sp.]MBO9623512.1 glycosyltransferase [Sphingomonas sp.]